jgi:outer membrane protein OmpA-like peptidoglycan-associated protein
MSPRRGSGPWPAALACALIAVLAAGCATYQPQPRTTQRDKTAKGAGIGAAAGAAAAILKGEREADEILAGAAIGAAVGGGVGFYLDRQEEKLARIPGTTVERVGDNTLLLRFQSDVLFPSDSAVISSGSRSSLDQVADVLVEHSKTAVVVQGYTDSTGTEEHNAALSERRARAVANHLVGRGVADDRISSLGMGEGYPVASNDTESGREQNRRVEILLRAKAR